MRKEQVCLVFKRLLVSPHYYYILSQAKQWIFKIPTSGPSTPLASSPPNPRPPCCRWIPFGCRYITVWDLRERKMNFKQNQYLRATYQVAHIYRKLRALKEIRRKRPKKLNQWPDRRGSRGTKQGLSEIDVFWGNAWSLLSMTGISSLMRWSCFWNT